MGKEIVNKYSEFLEKFQSSQDVDHFSEVLDEFSTFLNTSKLDITNLALLEGGKPTVDFIAIIEFLIVKHSEYENTHNAVAANVREKIEDTLEQMQTLLEFPIYENPVEEQPGMQKILNFLNLFGYSINRKDTITWKIFDDKGEPVGEIKYKKLKNKDKKREEPAVFGFVVNINSDKIVYFSKILENTDNQHYEFDLKREGTPLAVELDLGETPSIDIFGHLSFRIDNTCMYVNFNDKTEKHKVEETIFLRRHNFHYPEQECDKDYSFNITTCGLENSLDEHKNRRTISIISKYRYDNEMPLELQQLVYRNGKIVSNDSGAYKGTIAEVIEINGLGIDSFSRFRALLSKLLPLKEDTLSLITKDCSSIPMSEINVFFPDIAETNKIRVAKP